MIYISDKRLKELESDFIEHKSLKSFEGQNWLVNINFEEALSLVQELIKVRKHWKVINEKETTKTQILK